MEWVKPIDQVEADLRREGVFLLVDWNNKLWFYGYKRDHTAMKKMIESLRGRRAELVKFLLARARAKGEAT